MLDTFSGDDDITFTKWQVVMCRWLRSNALQEAEWLHALVNNMKGTRMKLMNLIDLKWHEDNEYHSTL